MKGIDRRYVKHTERGVPQRLGRWMVFRTPGPLALLAFAVSSGPATATPEQAPVERVPAYRHIVVIVEENKDFDQILNPAKAPNISRLAAQYGSAENFYGEVHPSEANYIALLAGDTFGIHDDDAFFCKPRATDPHCVNATKPDYVDHTIGGRHLGDQLHGKGLTWKGYYESIPEPGSLAVTAGDSHFGEGAGLSALYASKHSGFVNFRDVQNDPHRASSLVGFDRLDADIKADTLPAFALIVPNQCNEMHGLSGEGVPADCDWQNVDQLIGRGDREIGDLVGKLQATRAWKSSANMAIVITFDEGSGGSRGGCCGVTPNAPSNYGGGHIPTIVITNHGRHGVKDPALYSHYSLLRTLEDAFGIKEHLLRAGEDGNGVVPMTPLFAVDKRPSDIRTRDRRPSRKS
jgi:phospholipase C